MQLFEKLIENMLYPGTIRNCKYTTDVVIDLKANIYYISMKVAICRKDS